MISEGDMYPIVYEIRMTASELDIIIKALKRLTDPSKDEMQLLTDYEKLSQMRDVRACRKYGYMDEGRMNWQ